jgi:hypothetical protein
VRLVAEVRPEIPAIHHLYTDFPCSLNLQANAEIIPRNIVATVYFSCSPHDLNII